MGSKLRIFLLILVFSLILSCGRFSTSDDDSIVKIGVMGPFSISGGAIDGTAIKGAAQVALENIANLALQSGIEIRLIYEDSEYSVPTMIEAINTFKSLGVRAILSASTSENLIIVKDTAEAANIPMIDITSTSPHLALDDNLFRYTADDTGTAAAISLRMVGAGIQRIAVLYRDDLWGRDLSLYVKNHFEGQGGQTDLYRSYDARLPETDIETVVQELDQTITTALGQTTTDKVAVVIISFEEGVNILREASKYNTLKSVKWYGSDGIVGNEPLLEDATAAAMAVQVGFYCPILGKSDKSSFDQVRNQIEQKIGYTPYNVALLMYDAVMGAAATFDKISTDASMAEFKTQLYISTAQLNAVTGNFSLNDAGDRDSSPHDFWKVAAQGTGYVWVDAD